MNLRTSRKKKRQYQRENSVKIKGESIAEDYAKDVTNTDCEQPG